MPWKELLENAEKVLTMNQRNLIYVYPNNQRKFYPLADNKLYTKETLVPLGIPMPETYNVYGNFYELASLEKDLTNKKDFVIKPAQGSGGGGIIAIQEYYNGGWRSVSGKEYGPTALKKHISDIIFGVFSFDLSDKAIVEERLIQHTDLDRFSPLGLADVRIILLHAEPILSMARIPTLASDGKANLHQGGLGVGINLENGRASHAMIKGQLISVHPDTGLPLLDFTVPFWDEVRAISIRAARNLPLKYLGVDIAITVKGPVLLEINVRPGLEIQNINLQGMRDILETVHDSQVRGG